MIQVRSLVIDLDKKTIIVLDASRNQRNVPDSTGDIVPPNAVNAVQ